MNYDRLEIFGRQRMSWQTYCEVDTINRVVHSKHLTICGKKDGLGCQLNAKYSGIAFCYYSQDHRYVHTPFTSVSHGYRKAERVKELNEFFGIPDDRRTYPPNTSRKWVGEVFGDPNKWYTDDVLNLIRSYYWSTPKPPSCEQDIVIHIRRGDVSWNLASGEPNKLCRKWFYFDNKYYNKIIPWIANRYPYYTIAIHTEYERGLDPNFSQFEPIMRGWPNSLKNRITWKIGTDYDPNCKHSLFSVFHDMVTAKVLVGSISGLSYTTSLLNPNVVYYKKGGHSSIHRGQNIGLNRWIHY